MARGRMISKAISLDEKVNALSNDTVRLLFTWLIPHLDCEGRMYGDVQTVKSIVFPQRSMDVRTMQKYLNELAENGLIQRYSNGGTTYIRCPNFEKHQVGLNKSKEAPSQIPPPPPDLLQSNLGKGLLQVEVETKVKDKVHTYKEEEEEGNALQGVTFPLHKLSNGNVTSSVFEAYEKNIGMLSPMIAEQVNDALEHYPSGWIIDAIGAAVKQNKRSWAYTEGILKRWESEGRGDGKVRQNTKGIPGNRPTGAFTDLAERDKDL